jgi:16S rRNA (guanine527-N7)-methyltransferase
MDVCRSILVDGIATLDLALDDDKVAKMLAFIHLIDKWNKAYNLTAIKTRPEMVRLHLLDSLTVMPYLQGERIVDIGTGAGLPGIPLAIALPQRSFTLLDSNSKKTRFVQQAVLELKLTNINIVTHRVEDFQPEQPYDIILTRAFAELTDIVKSTRHLLAKHGKLLAMKGRRDDIELGQFKNQATIIPVQVPGVEAERNLIAIGLNDEQVNG